MLKNKVILFGLILLFNQATGQDYKKQFYDVFSKKDTIKQLLVLKNWEQTNSNDAELYVAYFNYYTTQSEKEILQLGQNPKEGDDVLQIMDQDSSITEPVGFIYSDKYYDEDLLIKGFSYIDKGIQNFPNRLDMRFGKIYMLGEAKKYKEFTEEIIKTVDYSSVNQNKWAWTDSKPFKDAKNEMLRSIQGYQLQLYDTEDDNLLDNMKLIAEAVLKNYPDNVESLSNLSIVFMIKGQYDNALQALLKAEKFNPKDCIVLNNIAHAYKLKEDNKNAIKYYELAFKYGDDETKSYAQKQIVDLKKKK
jgi:tetratricopeptide (TPR) repeat protein